LKSTFLEMFGDPVRNEKGWEKKDLGDISQIQGGLQVTIKRADNPVELPYLRVANVYRDFLNLSEIKTIKVTKTEAERVRLEKGDILVVEGHGNPTEIGRSAVWDGSIENCLH
jgi:type I restriction enzyme, S subunit